MPRPEPEILPPKMPQIIAQQLVRPGGVAACAACHASDPHLADRFPAAAREELGRRGRPVRLSLGVYAFSSDLKRCDSCHLDPHGGQFDVRARGKGCTACHQLASFARTGFDHGKDAPGRENRNPLTH